MGSSKPSRRSSLYIFWVVLFLSSPLFFPSSASAAALVVGESSRLNVTPSLPVVNSPGTKPGTRLLCERVRIDGLPRLRNLNKFSHSLKVTLTHSSSALRGPSVEVCFHRNSSVGVGMCSQGKWEKVVKGTWGRAMSPFDHKLLDIRMSGSSPENFELHIEEEFFLYRIVFLVVGIFLLSVASRLSKSLTFYYSSAMAVGVLLVILVVLFQGMRVLPTGRRTSLALVIYGPLIGFGSYLLQFVPNLLQSLLLEMGISEDMYFPLAVFLVAFIVLAGAWMGFWAVRKLILAEDGSVDTSTSIFVAWSIRIVAAIMVLQSSLDPLLGLAGIILSSMLSYVIRHSLFLQPLYKGLCNLVNNISFEFDESPFQNLHKKRVTFASRRSPTQARQPPDSGVFLSTFCTRERRRFSEEEWKELTEESTQKAVEELVGSADFSRWAAANADRISVTPMFKRRRFLPDGGGSSSSDYDSSVDL
ncbi:hypothetical protein LINGRAHAP2_LOCUS9068 [Linum grandiflorum]